MPVAITVIRIVGIIRIIGVCWTVPTAAPGPAGISAIPVAASVISSVISTIPRAIPRAVAPVSTVAPGPRIVVTVSYTAITAAVDIYVNRGGIIAPASITVIVIAGGKIIAL
jgi:hypothetical protein